MTEKQEKEPLFYIQQPNFQFPKTQMQTVYSSKKAEMDRKKKLLEERAAKSENTAIENQQIKQKPEETLLEKIGNQEKIQEAIEEYETKRDAEKDTISLAFTPEKRKPSFQRVKSFKEMNIIERIDYLHDFPKQLPPVPCIFETGEKAVRGFLAAKDNQSIEVKLFDGTTEKISIHSLKDVKMIGLRR